MARKLRTTISPDSGAPGSEREGRAYPHALLFPGSTATYPAGSPCPASAQFPDGLRWHDLVSDGSGNWIVRVKS
jgi:hypothetical protein